MTRRAWITTLISILIVFIGMGIRQSFGIFLKPITEDLQLGRETFSLAIAIQNIIFGLPLAGILADRLGPRWVISVGGVAYAAGLFLLSRATAAGGLYLWLGVVVGLALSSVSYVVILGAVGQVVPEGRRSTVFGLITAAGSLGMFAVVPLAEGLLSGFTWSRALVFLAAGTGAIALLALVFPGRLAEDAAARPLDPVSESLVRVLQRAGRSRSYWLLMAGFFVCGFHVAFIATHLPAFLSDRSVSPWASATALGLIGLANLFGSTIFGLLGDRYRKKYLLSGLYLGRAIVISAFLLLPLTDWTALLFGGAIGFLWLATVPLTSGIVAQRYGSRYLATLYGFIFFSHQVGAFLGVWLGGRVFDATGSYTPIWLAAIGLSVLAFLVHLPITDQAPVVRGQMAAERG